MIHRMQSFSRGSRAIGEAADGDAIKHIDTGALSEALKIHHPNESTPEPVMVNP